MQELAYGEEAAAVQRLLILVKLLHALAATYMSFVGEAVLCGVTARRRMQVAGQPAFFCFWSDNSQRNR